MLFYIFALRVLEPCVRLLASGESSGGRL